MNVITIGQAIRGTRNGRINWVLVAAFLLIGMIPRANAARLEYRFYEPTLQLPVTLFDNKCNDTDMSTGFFIEANKDKAAPAVILDEMGHMGCYYVTDKDFVYQFMNYHSGPITRIVRVPFKTMRFFK